MSVVPDGQLAYGIQLPVQALSLLTSQPWERDGCRSGRAARRGRGAADDAGFFYVAVCDHVAIPREKAETMSTTWYHPVATLGWIAGQTTQRPPHDERLRRRLPAPARDRQGVRARSTTSPAGG